MLYLSYCLFRELAIDYLTNPVPGSWCNNPMSGSLACHKRGCNSHTSYPSSHISPHIF